MKTVIRGSWPVVRCIAGTALVVVVASACGTLQSAPRVEPYRAEMEAAFPPMSDVYDVVQNLNSFRAEGKIDNYFLNEGENYFYAWKMLEEGEGILYRFDIKDNVVQKFEVTYSEDLPPERPPLE